MSWDEFILMNQRTQSIEGQGGDYFESYARLDTHMTMLRDSVRTQAFHDAIFQNSDLFRDKIVLDVGCGTGLLSLFAAQAGARRVIAVECSDMADIAKEIVKDNEMDEQVHVVKGLVEQVDLPVGIQQVDIIVSEWMGNALYMEAMLNSVIFARDKWLSRRGLILPSIGNLWLVGAQDPHMLANLNFWQNVEGFDMSCVRKPISRQPLVDCVTIQQLLTDECFIHSTHLGLARNEPVVFRSNFQLTVQRAGIINVLVLYFDVGFPVGKSEKPVVLSTSPRSPWTHWEQTLLHLDEPLFVKANDRVRGVLAMMPGGLDGRCMYFDLSISFRGDRTRVESFKSFNSAGSKCDVGRPNQPGK
ncbi:protein arginine N-methyltransferase 1 [Drosophila elegans]|uniref:protein arginine N-methyltransferase 1 n=1 Tax=Drosophila elegans TaxID=30023 RepID=UPI0007E84353|nr:protein arginine N-methyltransferase 1 [Drosophila elegans]XP_041565241.1 protein arginine N-methyltransferase 1 [Drosophila elegans]